MNEHINFQTINQNGHPAFVIIPYDDFISCYPKLSQKISYDSIPHEVVRMIVKDNLTRVCAWRKYLKLTQKEVATNMGVSQAAFSQMEKSDKLHKKTLQKIADALGLYTEQLK